MSTVTGTAEAPARSRPRAVLTFLISAAVGIALTITGELVTPFDLDNAVAVAQQGLLALLAVGALLGIALAIPSARRVLLIVLAVLTPLTSVAYFLAVGWIVGCAGVTLAWTTGALPRSSARPHQRLERVCGLVCAFTAGAWFLVYSSSLIADAL